MQGKRIYWIIGILILLLLIAVVYKKLNTSTGIQVAIEKASPQNITETVAASGKIYPVNEVKISPDASGEITQLYVHEGQRVNKGQVLCVIKSSAQPSIASFMPGATVTKSPDYKYTNIVSPISGEVSSLSIKQGERVVGTMQMSGTEIMHISDMSRMKVDIEVGENDIQKVKVGDSTIIRVDAFNNKTFKGLVKKIAIGKADNGFPKGMGAMTEQATSYTVSVEIIPTSYASLVENKTSTSSPFLPGMSATVSVITNQKMQVLAVPINAVTTRENDDSLIDINVPIKEYVFVVDDKNKAKQTLVTTGIQDNNYIEILSGLTGGEKIITAPYSAIARTLEDKKEVNIVDKKALFEKEKKSDE